MTCTYDDLDAPIWMADYAEFDIICMLRDAMNTSGLFDDKTVASLLGSGFQLDWTTTALVLGVGVVGMMLLME